MVSAMLPSISWFRMALQRNLGLTLCLFVLLVACEGKIQDPLEKKTCVDHDPDKPLWKKKLKSALAEYDDTATAIPYEPVDEISLVATRPLPFHLGVKYTMRYTTTKQTECNVKFEEYKLGFLVSKMDCFKFCLI